MINVDRAYKCPLCNTMIETYLFVKSKESIMFICPSCSSSYVLSEQEYTQYKRNMNKTYKTTQ